MNMWRYIIFLGIYTSIISTTNGGVTVTATKTGRNITGYFNEDSIIYQFIVDTFLIVLFWWAYLYNNARLLKVAGFLKEYAENNGYILKQESGNQTDDNNSNLRY